MCISQKRKDGIAAKAGNRVRVHRWRDEMTVLGSHRKGRDERVRGKPFDQLWHLAVFLTVMWRWRSLLQMDSKLKIKPMDSSVTKSPILNDYFCLFYLLENAFFWFCCVFVVVVVVVVFVCLVVVFGLFPHPFFVCFCFVFCFVFDKVDACRRYCICFSWWLNLIRGAFHE